MSTQPLDLVGPLSLSAMVGVLEQCRVVIGNDSGPRHLTGAVGAATVRAATVGVYWCGNLINAGPLTRRRHRVGVSFRSACPECGADQGRGRCPHDPSFVADVTAEDIITAALDLFVQDLPR
jgi:ADP-heptose:LPS heptosyltransferase